MIIKRSYIIAAVIAVILSAWILSGQIGGSESEVAENTAAEDTGAAEEEVFVQVRTFTAQPKTTKTTIRGRTEAVRSVEVRAETAGTVKEIPVQEGATVERGDTICRLSLNARDARMAEAEALMRQRYLEYDAAKKLAAKGHRSETQAAAARAAYDAAAALVKQAEVELGHTKITAPFEGVLEEQLVEVGDYLRVGDPCARIVDLDPFLIVGQVPESEVGKLRTGTVGEARLITGEEVQGLVRYLAKTADPATRTFRIELEVPNDDLSLRSGVTAQITVPSKEVPAHRLPPSILTLADDGSVGVRTVSANNIVHFNRVTILEDAPNGIWVAGLPERVDIITVGQEYVSEGQKVRVSRTEETTLGSAQ